MCGLFGAVGNLDLDVNAMQRLARRRGPDRDWHQQRPGLLLGMCRLRVLDATSAGDPPWCSRDGRVHALLNGEISNHEELRAVLHAQGDEFRSRCDGELIPALYARHGSAFVTKLRGPFALAVWDDERQRLLLARDRFGKKPLVYAILGSGLVFASDLRTLHASGLLSTELNRSAAAEFLHQGFVRGPATLLAGALALQPGHVLSWQDGRVCVKEFAAVARRPDRCTVSAKSAQQHLVRAVGVSLRDAVGRRLETTRSKAVLLSGGIDSGLIASYVSELDASVPCVTVQTGYDDADVIAAELTARHLRLPWQRIVMKPPGVARWHQFVQALGDPLADSSALACDQLFSGLKGQVAVALAGDGGDELFLGYRRYQALSLTQLPLVRGISRFWPTIPNASGARGWRASIQRLLSGARLPAAERLGYWRGLFDASTIEVLLPGSGGVSTEAARDPIEDEIRGSLAHGLLAKIDRTSMAHGIEVRCPFMDEAVVDLALQVPLEVLFSWTQTKPILRRLARGRLPPRVVARRKTGFGVPVGTWFRQAELREFVGEELSGSRWIDAVVARRLLVEHEQGLVDHGHRLFALLMIESWFGSLGSRTPTVTPVMKCLPPGRR